MLNKLNINESKKAVVVSIVLITITLIVYWQVNAFDFINVDDSTFTTDNKYVPSGITLEGIRWAFSTTYAGFYHPLTWLSFMLDYQLYGMNASAYHIINLIFHILSSLLLFWLLNSMTKEMWKSAFVAAFFALHPHHVESVAWIAERKDVLSVFFWMLTLRFYIYYKEKPSFKMYLFVIFCFACSLMSKSMAATLPVIMILLDYWPLKRFELKRGNWFLWQLKEKVPFFVLSIAFSGITLFAWQNPSPQDFPLDLRLANAPVIFLNYLRKILLPQDMHFFQYFSEQVLLWQVSLTIILILSITIFTTVMIKRLPYIFIGWMWYATTILPVIGIFQKGIYWTHDHYTYLPSIGIGIILAWGFPSLFKKQDLHKKILIPAGIFIPVLFAVISWHQCGYWKNSIILFSHDLKITKDNFMAHNFLGYSLDQKGKVRESLNHYNKAIQISSYYAPSYINRGNAYAKLGQYNLAIDDYTKAISLKGDYAEAFLYRGTVYGKIFKQHKRAIDDFNEALRLNRNYIDAYNKRGIVLNELGLYQKAIDDFNETIRLRPNHASAWNNRAFTYLTLKNINDGCSDAKKACELGNCKTLEWASRKGLCN